MIESAADRLAVIETCTRMAWHADQREWDALRAVFADEVLLDYTSQDGEPATVSRDQLVESWAGLLGKLAATQHLVTNHLVSRHCGRATIRYRRLRRRWAPGLGGLRPRPLRGA